MEKKQMKQIRKQNLKEIMEFERVIDSVCKKYNMRIKFNITENTILIDENRLWN